MITAHAHMLARMPLCATLAYDDIARHNGGRTSPLYTETATSTVSVVLCRTATTFR